MKTITGTTSHNLQAGLGPRICLLHFLVCHPARFGLSPCNHTKDHSSQDRFENFIDRRRKVTLKLHLTLFCPQSSSLQGLASAGRGSRLTPNQHPR